MRKGFIFNGFLCVNCKACSAACVIENGWSSHPREIFTYNYEALYSLPVANLSLACNHCENPVCQEGCPAGAYSREPVTGGIVVNETKCIGCNYCIWNCPYDAPKPVLKKGVIEKCNLCFPRLSEGIEPACTSGCPTGALKYDLITDGSLENRPEWFPDKSTDPAIFFTDTINNEPLRIVPEPQVFHCIPADNELSPPSFSHWSLIVFSFLATVSVAVVCSSLINGTFTNALNFTALIASAGIASLFHLGRRIRAWRAVTNVRRSPLSREIVLYITFSSISFASLVIKNADLLLASSVTGIILLLLIDSVYIFSDDSPKVKLHAGQTFISGLLLTSLLSGAILPFIFITSVKLALLVYNILSEKRSSTVFALKFFRIALLVIASAGIGTGLYSSKFAIFTMILAGELFDRIIFYRDFNPLNIKSLMVKNLNMKKDEKKISK